METKFHPFYVNAYLDSVLKQIDQPAILKKVVDFVCENRPEYLMIVKTKLDFAIQAVPENFDILWELLQKIRLSIEGNLSSALVDAAVGIAVGHLKNYQFEEAILELGRSILKKAPKEQAILEKRYFDAFQKIIAETDGEKRSELIRIKVQQEILFSIFSHLNSDPAKAIDMFEMIIANEPSVDVRVAVRQAFIDMALLLDDKERSHVLEIISSSKKGTFSVSSTANVSHLGSFAAARIPVISESKEPEVIRLRP